eukprot:COSAG01_NODE_3386_length_6153_cov_89.762471_3_plen_175_part_00
MPVARAPRVLGQPAQGDHNLILRSARPHTYLVQPAARADSLKELSARSALRKFRVFSAAARADSLKEFRDSQPHPRFPNIRPEFSYTYIHTLYSQKTAPTEESSCDHPAGRRAAACYAAARLYAMPGRIAARRRATRSLLIWPDSAAAGLLYSIMRRSLDCQYFDSIPFKVTIR